MKKFIKFTVVTAMLVGAVWYGYQNGKADGLKKQWNWNAADFTAPKKKTKERRQSLLLKRVMQIESCRRQTDLR